MRPKIAALSSAAPWITLVAGLVVLLFVVRWFESAARLSDDLRLSRSADEVTARVEQQIETQLSLLRATQALFETSTAQVAPDRFRRYVTGLGLEGHYPGLQGLGYVQRVLPQEVDEAEKALKDFYGPSAHIRPRTDAKLLFPVVFLEPLDERNRAAIGFDEYSDPLRRAAIDRAAQSGEQAMTGRLALKQEIDATQSPGFIVFQAVDRPDEDGKPTLAGLVYAPFRAPDFFAAALGSSTGPVAIEVFVGRTEDGALLYSSGMPAIRATSMAAIREIKIAGGVWTLRVTPRPQFMEESTSVYLPYVSLLGLLLIGALGLLSWQQRSSQEAAEREAGLMRTANEDKDLLLTEMKHRIKNVIARVQAISRQTTRSSSSVEDFQTNFDARLTAMGKTYDLLTRSQWTGAALSDVLKSELLPLTGRTEADYEAAGPQVVLRPREVLALGLTFHELTTNALKYGAFAQEGGTLSVRWEILEGRGGKRLRIAWTERPKQPIAPPAESGFGSRLVEATITRELNGQLERDFRPDGLRVVITIPLVDAQEKAAQAPPLS